MYKMFYHILLITNMFQGSFIRVPRIQQTARLFKWTHSAL